MTVEDKYLLLTCVLGSELNLSSDFDKNDCRFAQKID